VAEFSAMPKLYVQNTPNVAHILLALAALAFGGTSFGQEPANAHPLYAMTPAELPAADREVDWQLPPLPDPIDADEAEKLLGQLSAVQAAERQQAQQQLRDHGLSAGPALLKASRSGDPELALAARELLSAITKDNTSRRLHQMLAEEVQFGKISNQLTGLQIALSTAEGNHFARLVFAMRHQLGPSRVEALLRQTPGPEARRLYTWIRLLGHQHGTPSYALRYHNARPKLELLPEHEAYLERATASDDMDLRNHARKWTVAAGLKLDEEGSYLLETPPVRNAALYRLTVEQAGFVRNIGTQMIDRAGQEPEQLPLGLELLSASRHKLGKWTSFKTKTDDADYLERLASYFKHEDPRVRLRAAFGMVPPKISYKHNGSTQTRSLDTELFTRHRADELRAIADWMDKLAAFPEPKETTKKPAPAAIVAKDIRGLDIEEKKVEPPAENLRPPFPNVAIEKVSGDAWFTALYKVAPDHMATALRVLATDLVAKQGPEHEAILNDFAQSLFAFRLAATPMKDWPTEAHQILLEASIYSNARDPLIYTTQDQFNGQVPAFLLPVFEHGPVPANCGYAMIAAATCADNPEAIRVFNAALHHPSANHRVEAAMALAFLGEEAGREAARSILNDDQVSESLRSKAAVALAAMQDKDSYPAITKRFEALLPQPGSPVSSSSTQAKARTRYLYALRDARPEVAEDFVTQRLRSSRCPHCIRNSSRYCTYCSRDGTAVAALAYLWDLTDELPEENKTKTSTPHTQWEFVRFLKTAEPKTLDFQIFSPVLRVPAGKSLDLRAEAAAKIDQVTDGKTEFARLAKNDPDRLVDAYNTWRSSEAALPFLDKAAREKLEFELQLAPNK